MARRRPIGTTDDAGFTLVEVIVSLALLTLTATAALYFFVGGTRAVTHQQQSQNAVQVANEAMEAAYGVAAKRVDGASGLVRGRTQSSVEQAWNAAAGANLEGYSQSYPAWDPAATASSTQAVPISKPSKLSGLEYTATTLIGTCYRSKATPDSACVKIGATEPTSVPTGQVRLMRAMVRVTWQSQSCPATGCSYQVASLIDPNSDLVWNNTTKPVAVDDEVVVKGGESVTIEVLRNDIIGVVKSNPVRLDTTPPVGTATLQSDGTVVYKAPEGVSGIKTFTYSLKDQAGRESNKATIRVRILPKAVDDTATTSTGVAITIPVNANDWGVAASVKIVSKSGAGTATVSGKDIVYNPGSAVGPAEIVYSFVDADGLESWNTATVKITVTAWPAGKVKDLLVAIPATQLGTRLDLNMLGLTENPNNYRIEIMNASVNQGRLHVGTGDYNAANNRIGSSIAYSQQGNVLGVWTFQYRVLAPDGTASAIKTVTMVIVPTPQADTFDNVPFGAKEVQLDLGRNDAPMNFGGTAEFKRQLVQNPSCGALSANQGDAQNGIVRFDTPAKRSGNQDNKGRTCTFQYAIQGTGQYASLVSAPVTVTVNLK